MVTHIHATQISFYHLKPHVDLRLLRNNICIKYRHVKMQHDITLPTHWTVGSTAHTYIHITCMYVTRDTAHSKVRIRRGRGKTYTHRRKTVERTSLLCHMNTGKHSGNTDEYINHEKQRERDAHAVQPEQIIPWLYTSNRLMKVLFSQTHESGGYISWNGKHGKLVILLRCRGEGQKMKESIRVQVKV